MSLQQEHGALDTSSPSMDYIEQYYRKHPSKLRDILKINVLTKSQQAHIIRHIQALQRKRVKRVRRGQISREFFFNPNIKRAEMKKYTLFRDKRGTPHKRDNANGQFAHFNKSERRTLSKVKKLRPQR